ncbi:MAG: histidine phosphatase family protein [Candidatus Aenigmatarchaeota archaeon]
MRLIIVRHGETEENVKEMIQGHIHGKLTKKGIAQAKRLALRLKKEKIDAIFSSDLARAMDTVKEIAKFHDVKVNFTRKLRERSHGIFEGVTRKEFQKIREKRGYIISEFKPELGESYIEVRKRAKKFLDSLYKKYRGKTVLLMSHGGFNKVLLSIVMKKPLEESMDMKQGNTCVNIVEVGEKNRVHLINDTKHLRRKEQGPSDKRY